MSKITKSARGKARSTVRLKHDLTGRRFGRLVVIERDEDKNKCVRWLCQCDCENTSVVRTYPLLKGITQSCGCLNREISTKHGMLGTPEYTSWQAMLARCTCPGDSSYHRYGAKGIRICNRWVGSFKNFYADMGPRPQGRTLDRIDNAKGYSPENCRWATPRQQSNNAGFNRHLSMNDQTLTVAQWARKLGICYGTLISRVYKGWSDKKALTTPVRKINAKQN